MDGDAGVPAGDCVFDVMHIVWLGTARVLLASCLGVWQRMGLLGHGNYDSNLKAFSVEMKDTCREHKYFGPNASATLCCVLVLYSSEH